MPGGADGGRLPAPSPAAGCGADVGDPLPAATSPPRAMPYGEVQTFIDAGAGPSLGVGAGGLLVLVEPGSRVGVLEPGGAVPGIGCSVHFHAAGQSASVAHDGSRS